MVTVFEKYEGLGNDFLVVDSETVPEPAEASALCDRHFGVGGDGILVVGSPGTPGARARMTVVNADGSRPEMCGNGLRCVALHLSRQDATPRAEYTIDTDSGPLDCVVDREGDRARVRLRIGRAVRLGEHRERFEGMDLSFIRMSIGNPHAVLIDGPLLGEAAIDRIGPRVSAAIDGGTNVEFVRSRAAREFDLVVWERGVGRTLACGTGASATAAALALEGRAPYEEPFIVHLPGGPLSLTVARGDLAVTLEGPARHVFSGTWRG